MSVKELNGSTPRQVCGGRVVGIGAVLFEEPVTGAGVSVQLDLASGGAKLAFLVGDASFGDKWVGLGEVELEGGGARCEVAAAGGIEDRGGRDRWDFGA